MLRRLHLCEGCRERRKELSKEKKLPSRPKGVLGLGVVCPEAGALHGVKSADFSETCVASATPTMLLICLFLRELVKCAGRDGVLSKAV